MTTPVAYGVVAGLVFGAVVMATMLPHAFPDKRAALTAAFLDRFAIGFVIGVADLTWPRWVVGLCFGLLLSAPAAIITKAWRPILIIGVVGGGIIAVLEPHVVGGTSRFAAARRARRLPAAPATSRWPSGLARRQGRHAFEIRVLGVGARPPC